MKVEELLANLKGRIGAKEFRYGTNYWQNAITEKDLSKILDEFFVELDKSFVVVPRAEYEGQVHLPKDQYESFKSTCIVLERKEYEKQVHAPRAQLSKVIDKIFSEHRCISSEYSIPPWKCDALRDLLLKELLSEGSFPPEKKVLGSSAKGSEADKK